MPFNLLLFPLAGGYYIFVRSRFFKYVQHRSDRQRLLFNSIIAGIILLIATYLIRKCLDVICPNFLNTIWDSLPIKEPYFGTSVGSFVLSFVLTEVVNRFADRSKNIRRAILRIGNEMEVLLMRSVSEPKLILFTLKNDKFYIGWAKDLPVPSNPNYVVIIPAFSGYRDEKKNLQFTTEYLAVYAQYIHEGKITGITQLDTELIMKRDEIITINPFDIELYKRFNNPESDGEPEPPI